MLGALCALWPDAYESCDVVIEAAANFMASAAEKPRCATGTMHTCHSHLTLAHNNHTHTHTLSRAFSMAPCRTSSSEMDGKPQPAAVCNGVTPSCTTQATALSPHP